MVVRFRSLGLLLHALVVAVAARPPVSPSSALKLDVNTITGAFTISVGGNGWLSGDEYRVGAMSATNGDLRILGSSKSHGTDPLGPYTATTLDWVSNAMPGTTLYTTFREYEQDAGIIVFEQLFPQELNLKSLNKGSPLLAGTVFPGFSRKTGDRDLPCFAYHGVFPKLESCTVSTYTSSKLGGVPLVIYDDKDEDLPMVVMSPLSSPMAQQMTGENRFFFGAGVKATVEIIPAGWSQLFIVSSGMGINAGMMDWGERVLKFTGRPIVDNRYKDDVHGAIGFWTDNGGFYHYSIGANKSVGSNYEEVLLKVKAYHDELAVPFKHWQFDSWFYPKDGGVTPGGSGGAVTNWTSLPDVFPHGMAYMQSKLKLPIVMHNRQWSTHSDYMRNWPDIEWYISKEASVPKDPVKFFQRFFTQQEGWGLAMYEQDWMNKEYDIVDALQTNISMGDLWLFGMASGAEGSGRTVQYCMPYPSEILSASAYPAVTNARATHDYFHAIDQWAVGSTSLFYWALNILPFKDGFYSSSNKQVGGQTEGPEMNPDRETLMATLSCAMVGPMDGIYLLNVSRIMATCRKDGVILKPDRPITTTDQCFRDGDAHCKVYHTFSDVNGLGRVHYYFNNDGSKPLRSEEVYLKSDAAYAVYNWYTRDLTILQASTPLRAGYEGHNYAMVTPIQNGWIFLGEVGVYVPASTTRFTAVATTEEKLTAHVHGVPGERLRICAAKVASMRASCLEVSFEVEVTKAVSFIVI